MKVKYRDLSKKNQQEVAGAYDATLLEFYTFTVDDQDRVLWGGAIDEDVMAEVNAELGTLVAIHDRFNDLLDELDQIHHNLSEMRQVLSNDLDSRRNDLLTKLKEQEPENETETS